MSPVQTEYTERQRQALVGQIATMNDWDGDTRVVEPSSGIPFGRACCQGSSDKGVGLGGALATFVGVSIRDTTLAPVSADSDYLDEYPQYSNAGILTRGKIWVQPGSSVTAGAVVHYNATTGVFDDSGGSGPLPGARWETGLNADGLAMLRLSGIQRT